MEHTPTLNQVIWGCCYNNLVSGNINSSSFTEGLADVTHQKWHTNCELVKVEYCRQHMSTYKSLHTNEAALDKFEGLAVSHDQVAEEVELAR